MKNILKILKLTKSLHGLMIIIVVIAVLGSIFEIITPLLSGRILDEVIKLSSVDAKEYNQLIGLLAVSLVSTILFLISNSIGQRLGDHLAGKVRKSLTETFYEKSLTLPQSYFDSEISGKIINQLNRGISSIQEFSNTATNHIIPTILQTAIVIGVLFYYNILLGAMMLAILPLYVWISTVSSRRWAKKEVVKNKIDDSLRGRIQEVISNIKLVKGFTNEGNEFLFASEKLENINRTYAKQSTEYHSYNFAREFVLYIILFITSLIIFYNAFTAVISVGTVIILIQMVDRARTPLYSMSYIIGRIQAAEAGSKEYFEILALKSAEDFRVDEKIERIMKPRLIFKNVSFSYANSGIVLENINFEINDNEMVALVGPSGAGKSTIVNLILKFYEANKGKILLNGKSYQELTHNYIRKNIALVFQENELFSTTIKENVAYGSYDAKTKINDEKVILALKKANALEFVEKLKHGIDTQVGERGVRLSGGQRQRIQIARAIYKDAAILILDEATSSLDAKSEIEVSHAFENLVKERMVIVIAHRFSTIQNATKIIVLNNKKIEALGTPQELAAKEGIYADLLRYQIEGNEKLLKKFEIY